MTETDWFKPPRPFRIGDRVWCPLVGVGKVYGKAKSQVVVQFHTTRPEFKQVPFNLNGKWGERDPGRTLFHGDEPIVPHRKPAETAEAVTAS